MTLLWLQPQSCVLLALPGQGQGWDRHQAACAAAPEVLATCCGQQDSRVACLAQQSQLEVGVLQNILGNELWASCLLSQPRESSGTIPSFQRAPSLLQATKSQGFWHGGIT